MSNERTIHGKVGQLGTHGLGRQAFKVHEAAQVLGVSTKTIRRLIDRDKLRAVRVLRHILIPVSELEKLLS